MSSAGRIQLGRTGAVIDRDPASVAVAREEFDAAIFRLAPNVEHQVQRITGTVPRTTFAGWFRGGPDAPAMPRTSY